MWCYGRRLFSILSVKTFKFYFSSFFPGKRHQLPSFSFLFFEKETAMVEWERVDTEKCKKGGLVGTVVLLLLLAPPPLPFSTADSQYNPYLNTSDRGFLPPSISKGKRWRKWCCFCGVFASNCMQYKNGGNSPTID